MENILKVARTKLNMTQAQMANHMNVSLGTIRNWETRATIPSLFDAEKIYRSYRLTFQQIINHFKEEKR